MNEYMYNLVFEEINDRYINDILTYEQANELNDLAYEKYVMDDLYIERFLEYSSCDREELLYTESILKDIRKNIHKTHNKIKENNYVMNQISNIQKKTSSHETKNKKLNNKEFTLLKDLLQAMNSAKNFKQYSTAFKKFCKILNIPTNNVVVTKYKFSVDDDKRHKIDYSYATSKSRIFIPQGYSLYHKSQIDGLKELKPSYKGKSNMGYLYDKPRIYCSILKNMNNFAADISPLKGSSNASTHIYKIDEPIKTGFVDPLLNSKLFKAFYIETDTPIKIKQIK